MKKPPLQTGEWIVAVGALVLFVGMLVALFADRLVGWRAPADGQPWLQAQATGTNALLVGTGQDALRMIPVAARVPTAAEGLVLLQQTPQVNFSGKVQQVTEQPQSDGQLHVWLQDANGAESRISVGPGWFLKYLGCDLTHDAVVDGAGFTYERNGTSPLIYAKRIRINGRACQLRNDEGFALWSNKLR